MWMAAVLACGGGAVLSHHSAGMNWEILDALASMPHVSGSTRGRRRPGIIYHAAALTPDETTLRDGIPTTTVARTLVDLASALDPFRLERALAEAQFHRYPLSPSLPRLIGRHRGRRGVAKLKAVLGSGYAELGVTESPLEDRFLEFLEERRFVRPELNVPVPLGEDMIRIDCVWRSLRLAVELDGRAAHERNSTFESDRLRDRRLSALGWRPVRVTSEQVDDPDGLDSDLLALGVERRTRPRRPRTA